MRNTLLTLGLLTTLLTMPALGDPAGDPKPGSGGDLYLNNCAQCHGDEGKGDGPQARFLSPKPADLTVAKYKHGDSDDEVYAVIANGVPATGMQGWSKSFQPDEIKSIMAFIKTLRKPGGSTGK